MAVQNLKSLIDPCGTAALGCAKLPSPAKFLRSSRLKKLPGTKVPGSAVKDARRPGALTA
jgi:hypothetical protein